VRQSPVGGLLIHASARLQQRASCLFDQCFVGKIAAILFQRFFVGLVVPELNIASLVISGHYPTICLSTRVVTNLAETFTTTPQTSSRP